jgi:DNA repair exonuclease SbcCD ATPase subunit
MPRIYLRPEGLGILAAVTDERLLRFARELGARDERLAAGIAEVDELQHVTDELRERASALAEFLDRLPLERKALEAAVAQAQAELGSRQRALADATAEVERAEASRDEERRASARRAHVRARDAVTTPDRKLVRALEARETLEREAAGAEREGSELEAHARTLAARLAQVPRVSRGATENPEPGLAGTIAWSGRARAALFVVRAGLETERERVVREANELAASALGEQVAATSVALVRERIERA